jgi:hypothetical protein
MARVRCLEAVGEVVAAAALLAFCSLASTPSRWRALRRRREAWSPCSGGRKTVGGCFCWWRRRPFGEDDGSGAGWRPDAGRSVVLTRFDRCGAVDLGSVLQHGDEPRSMRDSGILRSCLRGASRATHKASDGEVLARIRRWRKKMVFGGTSRPFCVNFFCWGFFLQMFSALCPLVSSSFRVCCTGFV